MRPEIVQSLHGLGVGPVDLVVRRKFRGIVAATVPLPLLENKRRKASTSEASRSFSCISIPVHSIRPYGLPIRSVRNKQIAVANY